jgi:mannose-6-phosphate isomerase-like protein (cupin superfamily)
MKLNLALAIMATLPSTIVDKTGPDTAVRHFTGKELSDTLQKGMTPGALFSQVILAKHATYLIYATTRDKDGQAEVHQNWSDNIFIQEGETSFIVGGAATDAKEREPGEFRGSAISGGKTIVMHRGDYLFVPAGVPHQMIVKPGQRATFLDFKTHK